MKSAKSIAVWVISAAIVAAAGSTITDYDQQKLDELTANQATLTPADAQAALWQAAYQSLPKSVAWLLAHGAAVDGKHETGRSALMFSVLGAYHDDPTIERFERAFKDLPSWPDDKDRARREQATLHELLDGTREIDARDNLGNTALLYAAALRRFDLVLALHKAGADLNGRSANGETAIFFAPPGTLSQLVKLGADINAADKHGETVLHRAMGHLCDAALRDYVVKAIKAGARDSRNAKGQWASEKPEPALCPITDFGPNGMTNQNATIDAVRAKLKASRPAS